LNRATLFDSQDEPFRAPNPGITSRRFSVKKRDIPTGEKKITGKRGKSPRKKGPNEAGVKTEQTVGVRNHHREKKKNFREKISDRKKSSRTKERPKQTISSERSLGGKGMRPGPQGATQKGPRWREFGSPLGGGVEQSLLSGLAFLKKVRIRPLWKRSAEKRYSSKSPCLRRTIKSFPLGESHWWGSGKTNAFRKKGRPGVR